MTKGSGVFLGADVARALLPDESRLLQMQNNAPAIPRLGVAVYDWSNEAGGGRVDAPLRSLRGFQRIHLRAAGQALCNDSSATIGAS